MTAPMSTDRSRPHAGRGPLVALLVVLASTVIASCSEHVDPTGPGATPDIVIELSNFQFSQPSVTIDVGETVRWRNMTSTYHTVTPDGHTEWSEWQTSSTGETFDVTFDTPGTYDYYCNPHQSVGMTGTIVVQ